MEGKFSLNQQLEVTNKTLKIQYQPATSVETYTYEIIKDKAVIETYTKKSNKSSVIILDESGEYQIKVTLNYKDGKTKTERSGIYRIDVDKPVIVVEGNLLKMEQLKKSEILKKEDLKNVVQVRDKQDGNLFDKLECDLDSIPYHQVGLYDLKCSVSDEAFNKTEQVIKFQVTKSNTSQLAYSQLFIVAFLIIVIFFLIRYRKAIYYENKIQRYCVKPIKDKKIGILDKVEYQLYQGLSKMSKYLKKSVFLTRYSRKYEKYMGLFPVENKEAMNFVTLKLLVALLLVVITFFSKTIQFKVLHFYDLFIPFVFGFFLPNVIYKIKYKIYRNRLENDLLQAIIVMNNAFKSGRSITQAVELVTHELKGPICEEFKKMLLELSFGLSVEVVFNRFSKRIQLEEVTYLTASLAILNKTGGNIIKVFSAIEQSLFSKKKLRLEMKSLTGASRMIVTILFIVPFLFIGLIAIISPDYFTPFYTTPIGWVFLLVMVVIYLVYIWFVQKILKVRM